MVSRIVVLNDASVARGGATGLALTSIRLLRARGYAVTYIVGDAGDLDELRALEVEIVSLGGRQLVQENPLKAATRGIYNAGARTMVADWIAANDTPDTVYHLHGWSKILSPAIFEALRVVAPRTLIHTHDFFMACPNGGYMDYRRNEPCMRVPLSVDCLKTQCDKRSYPQKLWRVARQASLGRCFDKKVPWGGLVMIHEKMAPYLARAGYPASLMTTVRNPAKAFAPARIGVEDNRDFFFVGRVEAEKGIEELIAAATAADVPLKVIGEGPLREKLTRDHPDVEFFGWRSHAEAAELLAGARAVVMPSRYPEPFGLVAAEASRSGLPVILSRTAFLGDEIEDSGLGFVCDGRDAVGFATTLAEMRDLPRQRIKEMSEKGFAAGVRLSNTHDEWLDSLVALYERAVAGALRSAA